MLSQKTSITSHTTLSERLLIYHKGDCRQEELMDEMLNSLFADPGSTD